jgi:hypothetical protein
MTIRNFTLVENLLQKIYSSIYKVFNIIDIKIALFNRSLNKSKTQKSQVIIMKLKNKNKK